VLDHLKHTVARFIYRRYRKVKTYFLNRPPSLLSACFFRLLRVADKIMASRKKSDNESVGTFVFKQLYLDRYKSSPFRLGTDAPVAVESDDHKWPRGTINDNHRNYNFNLKLYHHFGNAPDLRHMDLGCSGGALVRSFLEDGYEAIGLEGSDVSKKLRSAEWGVIPHHLFTCDISKPFRVTKSDGTPATFHCISAWEVLEHIPESTLDDMIRNIYNHLEPNGIFVGSVDCLPDGDPLSGAVYHVTLHGRDWWEQRFAAQGLVPVSKTIFAVEDFVRGHGRGLKDWDPADGDGFHLVMRKR